jgi:hypothetical protein
MMFQNALALKKLSWNSETSETLSPPQFVALKKSQLC